MQSLSTHRADDVRDVRDAGAGGGAEVEDLAAGRHVDGVHAAQHARSKLRPERVPHSVLGLLACGLRGERKFLILGKS